MIIDIINYNAERVLLSLLEQGDRQNTSLGALHFRCSKLEYRPSEEDVLLTIRPALEDRKPAAIYFFYDDDIIITWTGARKATLEDLCHRLYERYASKADEKLHKYYDLQVHDEDLRLLCRYKIDKASPKNSPKSVIINPANHKEKPILLPPATTTQIANFRHVSKERAQRKGLGILIVEDQVFSQKLLVSLLDRLCKTHVAGNAEIALELYYAYAPNIVFLDVELPGVNGHELAATIHALDAEAYIVMVTGNNHLDDVTQAKANGAKGFIVKPYSKLKIMESIEKFINEHKSKH